MSAGTAVRAGVSEPRARLVSLWRIPRTRSLLGLTVVGVVVGVLLLAARLYTDVLWYSEIDQVDVFLTTLKWKLLTAGVVGLGSACLMLANLRAVERAMARVPGPRDDASVAAQLWSNRRLITPALAVAAGLLALGLRSGDTWQLLALWTKRSAFGVDDPLFHRDVGYFVFSLPLYREVDRWLLESLLLAAVASLAGYAAAGAFRPGRRRAALRAARVHGLVLAAALLLVLAWRFRLERFALALPHDGVVPGASYSDVHVRLPALRLLSALALVGAAVCLLAALRRRVPITSLAVLGVLAAVAVVAESELPRTVERFGVRPQALTRERPHVAQAIEFTRKAFGLDGIGVRPLGVGARLTRAGVAAERDTVENVALWDPEVLRPAMNELQSIGTYYGFRSVSVDRYTLDGRTRVVTVGARQLALKRLRERERSWANDRFAYTHGYGVAAVRASDTGRGHYPAFAERAFAPRADPLHVREPRIYFGEQPAVDPPYVVVNTRRAEVDAPVDGDRSPSYSYGGDGGIALSGTLRRLAFAARFHDLDLLLTRTLTDRSRILLHRNVADRLRTVAPFLHWDTRPQTAVIGGRVQFLFDGYTTSDSFPYSAPVQVGGREVNYLRSPARAVIDAFSGEVALYADPGDPLMRAWAAAYPGLFRPSSEMPAELRAHLRYPRELFQAQAAVYRTYHADDVTAFWNGSDDWAGARQLAGPVERVGTVRFPRGQAQQMAPSYLLARLPGDAEQRFVLAAPFTPRSGQNLVAFLAGSLGADGSPALTLLSLPRDRLTLGPTQATRRILSSAGVVRRLELLNRESSDLGKDAVSRTTLGALRVVPIAGSLVYVQPLFLSAGGQGVPRLQLVTVIANGRVGYGATFAAALRGVLAKAACSGRAARTQRCQEQRKVAALGDEDVDRHDPEHDREGETGEGAG